MIEIEEGEFVFYLTTKQKNKVDEKLKLMKKGNFNIRRYRYYYFLHLINVNGCFSERDRTYISTSMLHDLFKDWSFISEMTDNLVDWGIVKIVTKQFYNRETGKGKCTSYTITNEYKGFCSYKLNISYYDRQCRFVKKLIAKKHKNICDYSELEANIYYNLQKLSVVAHQEIIDKSLMLHMINRGDFNVNTWSTGRVGNEFCSVERVNRQYLRLDGKPLIEIDITNCQPLLATILFKRYFVNVELPSDLLKMIETCENGMFYEDIMDFLQVSISDREDFKQKFFELFFAPNYGNESKLLKGFKTLYPEVYVALHEIKSVYYKQFARDLQGIESTIIFNVYQQLMDKNISALTIHDSIVVATDEHAGEVIKLLTQEFADHYNLTPKLKVKHYSGGDTTTSTAINSADYVVTSTINKVFEKPTEWIANNTVPDRGNIMHGGKILSVSNYERFTADTMNFTDKMKNLLWENISTAKKGLNECQIGDLTILYLVEQVQKDTIKLQYKTKY